MKDDIAESDCVMRKTIWSILLGLLGIFVGWFWLQEKQLTRSTLTDEPMPSNPEPVKMKAEDAPVQTKLERVGVEKDDLTQIRGIGAVFQTMLYDMGILTFRDLAEQTPEQLAEHLPRITAERIRRDEWIEQAKHLRDNHATT